VHPSSCFSNKILDEKQMRLKFLFFPIVLVISLAIFAGFIWPEISNVKKVNEELLAANTELKAIGEKRLAIESIGKKISDNADGESIVSSYLPENKAEERIISGINYLASDANVSLVNISLSDAKDTSVPTNNSVTGISSDELESFMIDPMTGQQVLNKVNKMQSISVKISLVGDYDKIRIFLDNLQRMPVFNTIKSVNIVKQKDEAATAETSATILLADIDVNFGYLGLAKVDSQQVEKINEGLDDETISTLKMYVSQKSQTIGDNTVVKGKINPFVIN